MQSTLDHFLKSGSKEDIKTEEDAANHHDIAEEIHSEESMMNTQTELLTEVANAVDPSQTWAQALSIPVPPPETDAQMIQRRAQEDEHMQLLDKASYALKDQVTPEIKNELKNILMDEPTLPIGVEDRDSIVVQENIDEAKN